MASLPSHVHVSKHPALRSKLSQLRSKSAGARDVKHLIHDIALILSCEALATSIDAVDGPKVRIAIYFPKVNPRLTSPIGCQPNWVRVHNHDSLSVNDVHCAH